MVRGPVVSGLAAALAKAVAAITRGCRIRRPVLEVESGSLGVALVRFEGCDFSYTVRGSGPALLLVQGVGVQGDAWTPQTADLARDFTCVTFDNRGMGESQPIGTILSVEQMADDAL